MTPPMPRMMKYQFPRMKSLRSMKELRWRRQFRAEIFEDLAEDRDDADNEESRDQKRDANDDDRIGHGGFDFLAQTRAGFEESGKPIENFGEQTAVLAGFHHADVEPIENARMFARSIREGLAALHARGDVANDVFEIFLPLIVALLVERGHRLDERDAGFNHGRELAGEKHEVGFLDGQELVFPTRGGGFLLQ